MTNGERIRNARIQKGITQQELAKRLGISYVNISQYENGARNPKAQTLRRISICELLNPEEKELYATTEISMVALI